LTGILASQSLGRQAPQFIVDQGQESLGGVRVAVVNGV
jgi:hypothetical protein